MEQFERATNQMGRRNKKSIYDSSRCWTENAVHDYLMDATFLDCFSFVCKEIVK